MTVDDRAEHVETDLAATRLGAPTADIRAGRRYAASMTAPSLLLDPSRPALSGPGSAHR
jgi:hypothetical protein